MVMMVIMMMIMIIMMMMVIIMKLVIMMTVNLVYIAFTWTPSSFPSFPN